MTQQTDFNGWTNWETWQVAVLIDNSRWSYKRQNELARELLPLRDNGTLSLPQAALQWQREFATFENETRRYFKENDETGAPFSVVNWREIAENAIGEMALDRDARQAEQDEAMK